MQVQTLLSDQIARYLDLVTTETRLNAANMANVDTPGYKAEGIEFETEMRTAIRSTKDGSESQPAHVGLEDGLITRPDGNNVSMDREGMQLAEAQLKFKTGVALLRQQYQMVMDAIHSDK